MKNQLNIVNCILAVAVVALFVLHFVDRPKAVTGDVKPVAEGNLPVAYLNLDSLLANYTFAIEASDKLMAKQEDARAKLGAKMRTFQNEYADFQRKLENNAFLSRERAEREADRLQKKQVELEQLEQQLTQEILVENQKLNQQLTDSLNSYLATFNADGRYHLILANNAKDNVLMAAEGYDITSEVIKGMNARYGK